MPEIATDLNQPEILGATVRAGHTTSDAHLGAVSTENLIALRLVAAVWVYSVATAYNTAEHIVKHWLLFLLLPPLHSSILHAFINWLISSSEVSGLAFH